MREFLVYLFLSQGRKRFFQVLSVGVALGIIETISTLSILPFIETLVSETGQLSNVFLASLVENAAVYFFGQDSYASESKLYNLITVGCFGVLSLCFGAAFRIFAVYSIHQFIERIRFLLTESILSNFSKSDFLAAERFNKQNNLQALTISDVDQLIQQVIRPLFFGMTNAFILFFLGGILLLFHPFAAMAVFVTFGFLYLFVFRFVREALGRHGSMLTRANEGRFQSVLALINLFEVLRLSRKEGIAVSAFNKSQEEFCKSQVAYCTVNAMPRYLVEFIAFSLLIVVALFSYMRLDDGSQLNQAISAVALFGLAAYKIQPAALIIYQGLSNLRYGRTIFNKIQESSNLPAAKVSEAKSDAHILIPSKKLSIELANVSFRYNDGGADVIQRLSHIFTNKSNTLIVGNSGSGKSTLLKMLSGLLEPTSGTIERKPEVTDFGAVVPQASTMFSATIAENILLKDYVSPNDEHDRKVLQEVYSICELESFVGDFENIYTTEIHPQNLELSGGQLQRVAIARAYVTKTPFLFLDEATAALNKDLEIRLLNKLLKSRAGIIMISHNHDLIELFDEVLWVDEGTVQYEKPNTSPDQEAFR